MNIKIIDENKINFIIGGSGYDSAICECHYISNDIGFASGARNEAECAKKCCDEGLFAYEYVFIDKAEKRQDNLTKRCPR